MIPLDPPLRLATEADGPVLAVLNHEASHGLALHAWGLMADPGVDPWTVGIRRQSARAREGRWIVVDDGAGPLAGLLTWRASVPPLPLEMSAIFHPLVELGGLAPDALHINTLAALPAARGRGLGSRLLLVADAVARSEGRPRLSLIVADDNDGARRLYARHGYREQAARPMVKAGWDGPGSAWLLLVKDLS